MNNIHKFLLNKKKYIILNVFEFVLFVKKKTAYYLTWAQLEKTCPFPP